MNLKEQYPRGTRVRFLRFGEPDPSDLKPGTEGTVLFVDDLGTVHVQWENGSNLGMVLDAKYLLSGQKPDVIVKL